MITIKEIAKTLNMSPTTVSNVIHGKTKEVSPDTIKRVQDFLEEVEYVPNINARNLAQNKSKIIGVVLKIRQDRYSHIYTDPFVAEMLAGMEEVIRKAGYFMMTYISDDIAEILNHVSTWNVDGLILFCMLDDDAIRVRKKYHKPIACVDAYISEENESAFGDQFINIALDDEKCAYEGTAYLVKSGCRKVAFLADNMDGVNKARFRGYRRALDENGIEYSDRDYFALRSTKKEMKSSMASLVSNARRYGYDGVFSSSDLFAIHFIRECFEQGILVPEEISVVGVDDSELAEMYRPSLTTMHQDIHRKGALAAEALIRMLKGEKLERRQIVLKPELVVRESVIDFKKQSAE
ncbi:LacI family transcriptional regulator [Lachnospiraceae bacterium A10]|jgi:LacI family transcriptional regulator|nr:LacI family transcriptional regulator [Lachnospiraceae bacterium A10]